MNLKHDKKRKATEDILLNELITELKTKEGKTSQNVTGWWGIN